MARPRQYDPETLRAAVVAAARGLLEEGGPPALTARALAQASGATSGTIYASFGDLHSVLIEVNRDTFRELGEMIDTLPDAPPEPWLYALAEAYVDFMLERKGVWRGLFEGDRVTDVFPQWYMAAINALLAKIAHPIAALAPSENAAERAEELFISVHGVVALAAIGRLDMVSPRSPKALARAAVNTMLSALKDASDA